MTAKQLLEMTKQWYKAHEQLEWTREQLDSTTKKVEELEGWRTALEIDNSQLRRQLGFDETDYKKGKAVQGRPNHDRQLETDGGVGPHDGISPQPKQ